MIAGIEASNILAGGGVVHLRELLSHATPSHAGFSEVLLWAPQKTLDQLPSPPWLKKCTHSWLNRSLFWRLLWLKLMLPSALKKAGVRVLFSPGANSVDFPATVSMCQNLLPFDPKESQLYGWSWMRVRLWLLRHTQLRSFRKARKVILLTPSNEHYITGKAPDLSGKFVVIPHGVHPVFFERQTLKKQKETINVLYVSIVDVYKHQWNVVEAVQELLNEHHPVQLKLVGSTYPAALEKLKASLNLHTYSTNAITYLSAVPYEELSQMYHEADIFVFASSCETFSLVLLEAMASGLPIACSDRDTLHDTLQDAGVYFDPYSAASIKEALIRLIEQDELRKVLSRKAESLAKKYTWKSCADQTFHLLAQVAMNN